MIENIILLLLGGFFGFIFKLLYDHISKKEPLIIWRIFPEVNLPTQEMAAFNIIVENRGAGHGKNIRAKILFTSNTEISSFEINPSEPALKIESSNQKNEIDILLPQMPSNQGFLISILTKGEKYPNCKISIIGDDNVVGRESTKELSERKRLGLFIATNFLAFILGMIVIFALISYSLQHNILVIK